jgi:hypothetical protein
MPGVKAKEGKYESEKEIVTSGGCFGFVCSTFVNAAAASPTTYMLH